MHLKTRNVNSAFHTLVTLFHRGHADGSDEPIAVRRPSRNGPVLMIDEPVTVTYSHPRERILFNAARDCNPFMHLYEALWMLAGRNDVAPLTYYTKRFAEYSDDGETFNGAYGYRWRHADTPEMERDQLDIIVEHLRGKPESRRAVLQMWNVTDDLMNFTESKDVCCNLSVLFSLRRCGSCDGAGVYKGRYTPDDPTSPYVEEPCENHEGPYLDMTVLNRSNDLVWGMLGANYVHFTFLQEYVAARLGVEVGRYHHVSNNLHAYESNWRPEEWLADATPDWYSTTSGNCPTMTVPLVEDPATFEAELPRFVDRYDGTCKKGTGFHATEPFLKTVATPMFNAFFYHKEKDPGKALEWAGLIAADDWRISAQQWLERRLNKKERA